jgi:hypothetical protein
VRSGQCLAEGTRSVLGTRSKLSVVVPGAKVRGEKRQPAPVQRTRVTACAGRLRAHSDRRTTRALPFEDAVCFLSGTTPALKHTGLGSGGVEVAVAPATPWAP